MKTRVIQDDPDPSETPTEPARTEPGRAHNLAARTGRWSAQHRKLAIIGWLVFAIAAFGIGTAAGTNQIDQDKAGNGESGRAQVILADHFKQSPSEDVLVQSMTLTTTDQAFRDVVQDVVRRLSSQPDVQKIRSPLATGNTGQLSADGHSALVSFQLKTTDTDQSYKDIVAVEESITAAQAAHPSFTIGQFGDASSGKALDDQVKKDFEKAGLFSLPVTLIVLIAAFGALIAAGLPLLLGLTAVIATLGLLAIPSRLLPMDSDIAVIVLLIGLAVGVDYAMFYLKRERQERAAGNSEGAALEAAAASSGRAVLISGLTMIVAMAGMFFIRDQTFTSFAFATMLVVGVAVLGSLTVLPAVLAALGDKVDKLSIPFLRRLRRDDGEGRFWNAILTRVLAHPVIAAVASAGVLVALALPALQLHTSVPGPETYPQSLPVMQNYTKIQKVFPGGEIPASVVIQAPNVRSTEVREAIGQLEWRALASGQMHEPISLDVNKAGTVAVIDIPVDGKGTDAASEAALATLRNSIIPVTVGALKDTTVAVTGETAGSKDFNDQMKSAIPWVFAFVLTFAFVLLLVSFRSIVIPIKAVLLNLLSVASSYGVLVLIFQHGWGKGLLGFDYTGGIVAFLPVFLFVILFGLSMDYHVFVLSRVRESYDRGMTTDEAVAHGIKSTASVVTSAAIVMVGVFSIFGTLSVLFLKQFGIGLAIAVLLDATIVRAILLPATMKLLGDWNWYLPKWLRWLPRLEHGESVEHVEAVPALGRVG
jgi:RND superfamily putative drug exporter